MTRRGGAGTSHRPQPGGGLSRGPPEPTYIEIDMRYKCAQQKQIRALGGKFDGQRQRWYVPAGQSVKPFAEWLA